MPADPTPGVRVPRAELLASLSLAVDLGLGQPMEHVLRQTVIGMRLAERAGMDEATLEAVYYVSLIAWVGCTADSAELARLFGDERWDGKGSPARLSGEDLAPAVRVLHLADIVEVYDRLGGPEPAMAVARERRGGMFDPALVDRFCEDPTGMLVTDDDLTPASGPAT